MSTALSAQGKTQLQRIDTELRKREAKISAALPPGVKFERFMQQLMLALVKNPKLLRCTFQSLFTAISEALLYGLEIGSHRQLAYLVPYKEQAQLIPSYKGLVEFVRRTGQLEDWSAETVHEGDLFEMEMGDSPKLRHVPTTDPDRQSKTVTHVYAVFRLTGGRVVRNVWTSAQVNAHKEQYSPGWRKDDSPWQTAWRVMAIKTVIRDMINRGRLPMSEAEQAIAKREDEAINASVVATTSVNAAVADLDLLMHASDEVPEQSAITHEETDNPVIFQGVPDQNFVATLELAVSLGAVSALEEAAIQQCKEPDEIAYVRDVCRKRRDAIASARSEG